MTGRPLSPGELTLARRVFGPALAPERIEIRPDKFTRFQPDGAILAEARRLWFGPAYREDFAEAAVPAQALLIHELTHCAQAQAGMDIWIRGAFAHMRAALTGRSAYAYDRGPAPLLGRPFEHQAAMIEDAVRLLGGHPPRREGARLGDLLAALGHASEARASRMASFSFGAPPLLNTPLR